MTPRGTDPLLLAGKVLTILLQGVVGLGLAALAIALPLFALGGSEAIQGFAEGAQVDLSAMPVGPTIALMAILALVLAGIFVVFGKLRAIIDTVGEGEPFVPANAERLSLMAWIMLGIQVLLIPAAILAGIVIAWANTLEGVHLSAEGDGFDLTGVLMVIVLFILARVFRIGAALREDLEGTV